MNDLTGKRFGYLTVIMFAEIHTTPCGTRRPMWLCRCDCGKEKIIQGSLLVNGNTKSCGCWKTKRLNAFNKKHGGAVRSKEDRLYGIWKNMKRRCTSPKDKRYSDYGGKGIFVCDDWNVYENFRKWAYENGYDEKAEYGNCTIDRIDNNGNYEPSNCRWVDRITQANNTSRNHYVELNGQRMTIAEFSRAMNISKNHAWYYLNKFEREVVNGQANFITGGD